MRLFAKKKPPPVFRWRVTRKDGREFEFFASEVSTGSVFTVYEDEMGPVFVIPYEDVATVERMSCLP